MVHHGTISTKQYHGARNVVHHSKYHVVHPKYHGNLSLYMIPWYIVIVVNYGKEPCGRPKIPWYTYYGTGYHGAPYVMVNHSKEPPGTSDCTMVIMVVNHGNEPCGRPKIPWYTYYGTGYHGAPYIMVNHSKEPPSKSDCTTVIVVVYHGNSMVHLPWKGTMVQSTTW
jgi:hypothetical protein